MHNEVTARQWNNGTRIYGRSSAMVTRRGRHAAGYISGDELVTNHHFRTALICLDFPSLSFLFFRLYPDQQAGLLLNIPFLIAPDV